MKKLVASKDIRCMACLSCVRACSEAFYKVFDPAKSCIQIVDNKGEAKDLHPVRQVHAHLHPWSDHPEPQDRRVYDQ